MKYVISESQLFELVENFMSERMKGGKVNKGETTQFGTTRWDLYDKDGKWIMYYYHTGQQHHADGSKAEDEWTSVSIDERLVTLFGRNLRFRESKVMDLMADWFTKTFGLDVDDVSVYK